MKFYSETLKKTFDSAEECLAAEKQAQAEEQERKRAEEKKKSERKARAEAVEAARAHMAEVQAECAKKIDEAQKAYLDLRNEFIRDYGYYHCSSSDITDIPSFLDALINFQKIM